MKNIITYIQKNGTNPTYSDELNSNIEITNIFIICYILLIVPFVFWLSNSVTAAIITIIPILIHILSFILIGKGKHTIGRFLFSINPAISAFMIAVMLYNVNETDGMGAKFLILGSIILPFIVFRASERIYSIVVIIILLVLIFSFNTVNDLVDITITTENYDTPIFRAMTIFTAFSMIAGIFFYYQQLITNKNQKLIEKTAIIKERNEELAASEEELKQYNEELLTLNEQIEKQKADIEKKHKNITDSINYAKRIQEAMLPAETIFGSYFSEYFILFKPRDIVSGDFYWAEKIDNKIVYAVADCTGHGVPGAMVSMLGISLLNRIISNRNELKASSILDNLRTNLKQALKQYSTDKNRSRDGMDISLCIIDTETRQLQFSGAYNSLYIFRDDDFITIKADRQPIGTYIKETDFTNNEFQLMENDILYSFSDGFADQFNGSDKKYTIKKFRQLLSLNANKRLTEQKIVLNDEFLSWKGYHEQTDDIVVVGIKV